MNWKVNDTILIGGAYATLIPVGIILYLLKVSYNSFIVTMCAYSFTIMILLAVKVLNEKPNDTSQRSLT